MAAEALISRTRLVNRNVKRWRGGQMTLRWGGGGCQAHWRKDGTELFYLDLKGTLTVVDVCRCRLSRKGRSTLLEIQCLPR